MHPPIMRDLRTAIWLDREIPRLHSGERAALRWSGMANDAGEDLWSGRVGGVRITGNVDGIKPSP